MANARAGTGSPEDGAVHFATKADIGEIKALIASVETSLIKWVVGTGIAGAALAFAAARLIR